MKFWKSGLFAATGLAALMSFATPAAADFWWDTDEGKLYFEGASGNWGVFYFLTDSNELNKEVAIYLDGVGPQYSGGIGIKPGTYSAQWFNYNETGCSRPAVDPDGRTANDWGVMNFTVKEDYNYFSAEVFKCEENEPVGTFTGKPGT